MNFDNVTTLVIVALFLVPGFVMTSVRSRLVPRSAFSWNEKLLQFFTLSCVNNAVWAAVLVGRPTLYITVNSVPRITLLFLLIAFVSPTVIALFSAFVQQKDLIGEWLPKLRFRVVNPAPSAWDWHLSQQQSHMLEVKLKSGESIYGHFADKSMAGDQSRDLFIELECERVILNSDSGPAWKPLGKSIWIPESEIQYVRFFREPK
jgi:hypothetical protein